MAKYSKTKREEARRLYLTGEATTVAEIARRLKTKPHTVGQWRKEEDWDGLRLRIDRQAAEKLVEQFQRLDSAPDATRAVARRIAMQRLYIETMESILRRVKGKVILESGMPVDLTIMRNPRE